MNVVEGEQQEWGALQEMVSWEPRGQQGREGQWPHWQGTQSYCIWARRAEQVQWQEPGSSTVQWSPGKSVVLREVQDWVRKSSQQDKSRTNKTQGWAWHPYNTAQARTRGKTLNLCWEGPDKAEVFSHSLKELWSKTRVSFGYQSIDFIFMKWVSLTHACFCGYLVGISLCRKANGTGTGPNSPYPKLLKSNLFQYLQRRWKNLKEFSCI